ncbi:hypothetical protein NDU88_009887 [Pleurodeles waltl]|uniref:Uncharacterized protein n=1 Tax=Pleurodeles waltl TaxID=8319 RepID=A0AAV7PWL5_PLEWA|nr:hypothetical protein NDU88_009887 [Pleurodeles waltl]
MKCVTRCDDPSLVHRHSSEEPGCRQEAAPPQGPSRTGCGDAPCLRPWRGFLSGDGGSGPTGAAEDAHPGERSEWPLRGHRSQSLACSRGGRDPATPGPRWAGHQGAACLCTALTEEERGREGGPRRSAPPPGHSRDRAAVPYRESIEVARRGTIAPEEHDSWAPPLAFGPTNLILGANETGRGRLPAVLLAEPPLPK